MCSLFSDADYVLIISSNGQSHGTFCGEWTGKTMLILGDYVVIAFQSDSSIQERGFVMYFSSAPIGKYKELKINYHLSFSPPAQNAFEIADPISIQTGVTYEPNIGRPGAHYQERPTPILSLCHGIFTDRFIFRVFVK